MRELFEIWIPRTACEASPAYHVDYIRYIRAIINTENKNTCWKWYDLHAFLIDEYKVGFIARMMVLWIHFTGFSKTVTSGNAKSTWIWDTFTKFAIEIARPQPVTSSITWKRGWQVIRFPDFNILRFSSYPKWDEPERGGRLVILSLFCSAIGTKWYSFCLFKPSYVYAFRHPNIFQEYIRAGCARRQHTNIYLLAMMTTAIAS